MPPRATADVDREQAAVANDRTAPAADDPVAVSIELQGSCRTVDTQEHTEVSALELAEVLEGFGVVHQPAPSMMAATARDGADRRASAAIPDNLHPIRA